MLATPEHFSSEKFKMRTLWIYVFENFKNF